MTFTYARILMVLPLFPFIPASASVTVDAWLAQFLEHVGYEFKPQIEHRAYLKNSRHCIFECPS